MVPARHRAASLLAIGCAFAACSAPDASRRPSPLQSAERILKMDLAPTAIDRSDRLRQLPTLLAHEAERVGNVASPALASRETARLPHLVDTSTRLAAAERNRSPAAPAWLLPSATTNSRNLADGTVHAAELVFGNHRALGELDDRRHRTDPDDARPEATWWQRLRRRLWL